MNLVSLSDSALLPDGLAADLHEGVELARAYCLQCHMVNGFGGEKHPGNLAEIAKAYPEPAPRPMHGQGRLRPADWKTPKRGMATEFRRRGPEKPVASSSRG